MSRKVNVRQQELRERLRDMLRHSSNYVQQHGYDQDIDIEKFLAEYRLLYAVGHYASQRYFDDFATNARARGPSRPTPTKHLWKGKVARALSKEFHVVAYTDSAVRV